MYYIDKICNISPVMLGFFCFLLFAGSCHIGHNHEESDGHTHSEDTAPSEVENNMDEVHLVQKQIDVMGIQLGEFQNLDLSTSIRSNGRLELPPQNKASVSALMGGRVTSIHVLEGDKVQKGEILATLEHPEYVELQKMYLMTLSELHFLEKEYLRKKVLYQDSISSAKEFQQAESIYLTKKAESGGFKAKLQMLNIDMEKVEMGNYYPAIPILSPIDGFVRLIKINMGMFVQPERELFEIVDNDHIHIDLMVYEKDMDMVRNKQRIMFSLSTRPDFIFQGRIFALGKSFEDDVKAMQVHAEIDNKQGILLPGMYVDARIITNTHTARALPDDAIVSDGGLNYIFVLDSFTPGGHSHSGDEVLPTTVPNGELGPKRDKESDNLDHVFRKIEVNIGAKDIGFTEVVPAFDLPDDIQVVIKGAFYLLAEMKKGEGGHGHHH